MKEAATYDVEKVRVYLSEDPLYSNSVRRVTREKIIDSFRLSHYTYPIVKELNKYKIYHEGDMADALTAAYFLHARGEDPVKALKADYILAYYGLLTWEDVDQLKEEGKKDKILSYWRMLERHYRNGDRVIYYDTQVGTGLLLVRGERLVYECELVHKFIGERSLRWDAAYDHFLSLGGNKGFLAGDFVWPDPD
jgi:hypothetical protein